MDLLWLPIAFLCGFIARQFGLPPLVGFLVAGFTAHTFDVRGGEVLETMGDIGVTLLLFTIGLKLDVRGLLRPQIWAVASIHMIATVVLLGAATFAVSFAGLSLFGSLDLPTSLLIAFAMSFSSTVFAVKVLEEREELSSTHGRIAIGILIMQDVFAVVFITASSGTLPSPWAILLVGLFVVRPLLVAILQRGTGNCSCSADSRSPSAPTNCSSSCSSRVGSVRSSSARCSRPVPRPTSCPLLS